MRRAVCALAAVIALGLVAAGCGEEQKPQPTPQPTTGNLSGVVSDKAGKGLAGAEITTEPSSGAAVTDAAGAYALTGVPAGTYAVRAALTGYKPAEKTGVAVAAGGSALVDLTLEPIAVPVPKGAIAGKVTDQATQAAVAGATLTTTPAGAQATSAADGTYRLELDAGSYVVAASAAGYDALSSASASVRSGQTTALDLQLVATVVYESTCAECHVSAERLLADLTLDPLPAPPGETGSTGEG